jgi:HEAT repeat protein
MLPAMLLVGCDLGLDADDGPAVSPQAAYRDSRARLLQGANHAHPVVRSHAIEGIAGTFGKEEAAVLMDALDDKYIIVQYAGASALGDVAYAPAERKLESLVMNPDVDDRVAAAAIYALHEIGNNRHASLLARILRSPSKWSRAAAATAMGQMGEPSAIGPLRSVLDGETAPAAKLAMIEALAELGDEISQRLLEAYVRRPEMDMKLAAIPAYAKMPGGRVETVLRRLIAEKMTHPSVRVVAAGALAGRGVSDDDYYEMCIQAARDPKAVLLDFYGNARGIQQESESVKLQHLAALALGEMKRRQAVDVLYPLLDSESGEVQVAAAVGILKILGHDRAAHQQQGDSLDDAGEPLAPAPLPSGELHTSGAIEAE